MFDHRDPYPHRRRFELKIFADGNSLAHALTYLQDPLCWWTYNATYDCRPANRGRLCLWRPANYLKLAPFKPPRPLSIHLYLPTRPLYLARFNPYSPPPSRCPCVSFIPELRIFVAPDCVSFALTSHSDFPSSSVKTPSSFEFDVFLAARFFCTAHILF